MNDCNVLSPLWRATCPDSYTHGIPRSALWLMTQGGGMGTTGTWRCVQMVGGAGEHFRTAGPSLRWI